MGWGRVLPGCDVHGRRNMQEKKEEVCDLESSEKNDSGNKDGG